MKATVTAWADADAALKKRFGGQAMIDEFDKRVAAGSPYWIVTIEGEMAEAVDRRLILNRDLPMILRHRGALQESYLLLYGPEFTVAELREILGDDAVVQ